MNFIFILGFWLFTRIKSEDVISCPKYSKLAISSELTDYYRRSLFKANLNWNDKNLVYYETTFYKTILELCDSVFGHSEYKRYISSKAFIIRPKEEYKFLMVSEIQKNRIVKIQKWKDQKLVKENKYSWSVNFESFEDWQTLHAFLVPFVFDIKRETNYSDPITIFAKNSHRFLEGIWDTNLITKGFLQELEGSSDVILAKLVFYCGLNLRPNTFLPFLFALNEIEFRNYSTYDSTDFDTDQSKMQQFKSEYQYRNSDFAKDSLSLMKQERKENRFAFLEIQKKMKFRNYTVFEKAPLYDTDWPLHKNENNKTVKPYMHEFEKINEEFEYEDLELFKDNFKQKNIPVLTQININPLILEADSKIDLLLNDRNKMLFEIYSSDNPYILSSFISQFFSSLGSFKQDIDRSYERTISSQLLINRIFFGITNNYNNEFIRFLLNLLYSSQSKGLDFMSNEDLKQFLKFFRRSTLGLTIYIRDCYRIETKVGSDYFYAAGRSFYEIVQKLYENYQRFINGVEI